jgi:coenzyme F420 hydrogenase subunit beta
MEGFVLICPPSLCNHCGACEVVCPVEIVKFGVDGYPFVDDPDSCINCSLCDRVCSGTQVNFESLSSDYGLKSSAYHSPYLGYYSDLYLSHSTDDDVRRNASAGGVITGLLSHAFDSDLIDGAVVVRMSNSDPMRAEGYIATSKEELGGSLQSKYQPVSLIRLLKEAGNLNNLAFVGTGCQVESIRKLGQINPRIRSRIKYAIGIFCAYGNNHLDGTKFLVRKMGFDRINRLSYRAGDYPGNFTAEDDRKKKSLSKNDYKWFSLLFTEYRCMNCIDYTNELADISVGDSYSLSEGSSYGKSVAIVRNQIGRELISTAYSSGYISYESVDASGIVSCQRYQFNISKKAITDRVRKRSQIRKQNCPVYVSNSVVNKRQSLRERSETYITFFIFRTRNIWISFFGFMPFALFKWASRLSKRG